MRIVDVRPEHENEDVAAGKKTVKAEIAHPAKSIILVLGTAPEVSQLADRAGTRSDAFPWREAIWLKLSRENARKVVGAARFDRWFADAATSAIVLDFDDKLVQRLPVDASLLDIEKAFLNA